MTNNQLSPIDKKLNIALVVLLIAAGLALRLTNITPAFIQDGDAGVSGLLAKHILEGREFPIYSPLSHYGGVFISYVGALLFWLFGISTLSYCLIGVLFSLLWGFTAYLLARRVLGFPGAIFALVFLALPPYFSLSLSTYVTGVYAETFILTPYLLLLFCDWGGISQIRLSAVFGLGFLLGFGLWVSPWVFPAFLTIGSIILIQRRRFSWKEGAVFAAAFLSGYLPAIIYNFQYPGAQLFRFGGRVLSMDRTVLSSSHPAGIVVEKILWRLSTMPSSLAQIPALLISSSGWLNFAGLLGGFWVLSFMARKGADGPRVLSPPRVLLIYAGWYCLFYVILIGDNFPRYVAPLLSLLPVLLGAFCSHLYQKSRLACLVVFSVLVMHNGLNVGDALARRDIPGYQSLSAWMLSEGLFCGYADSETAYAVMFESRERIALSPTLYHPTYTDRWPRQTEDVRKREDVVFIVNARLRPRAAASLDQKLRELGVSCRRSEVGEFIVYREFSRKVLPEELHFQGEKP